MNWVYLIQTITSVNLLQLVLQWQQTEGIIAIIRHVIYSYRRIPTCSGLKVHSLNMYYFSSY